MVGRDGLQTRGNAGNILNKHLWTVERGGAFFQLWDWATDLTIRHRKKKNSG